METSKEGKIIARGTLPTEGMDIKDFLKILENYKPIKGGELVVSQENGYWEVQEIVAKVDM